MIPEVAINDLFTGFLNLVVMRVGTFITKSHTHVWLFLSPNIWVYFFPFLPALPFLRVFLASVSRFFSKRFGDL